MDEIPDIRLVEIALLRLKPTMDELRLLDKSIRLQDRLGELMNVRDFLDSFDDPLMENDPSSRTIDFIQSLKRTGKGEELSTALRLAFPLLDARSASPVFVFRRLSDTVPAPPKTLALGTGMERAAEPRELAATWVFEAKAAEFPHQPLPQGISAVRLFARSYSDGMLVIEPQGELRMKQGYRLAAKLVPDQSHYPTVAAEVSSEPHDYESVVLQLPNNASPVAGDILEIQIQFQVDGEDIDLQWKVRFA